MCSRRTGVELGPKLADVWPAVVAIGGPIIALVGSLLTSPNLRQPGLYKHVARQAALLKELPDGSPAQQNIIELLELSTTNLKAQEEARLARTFNRTNLIGAFFFFIVGGIIVAMCWWWAVAASGTPWAAVALVLLGIAGFFTVIVVLATVTQLYVSPKAEDTNPAPGPA
jgi:hypothetical protein